MGLVYILLVPAQQPHGAISAVRRMLTCLGAWDFNLLCRGLGVAFAGAIAKSLSQPCRAYHGALHKSKSAALLNSHDTTH